ncbi:hypothetical protein Tco_1257782 [Tanacetum coccineum]
MFGNSFQMGRRGNTCCYTLAVKSPSIVDWKIHKEGRKIYYQIIRADEKSQMYMIFCHMLKSFNREDLKYLYKLVKAKCESTRSVEDLDLLLWGDLKTMFEPYIYMLVEKKYPLAPLTLSMMLEKKLIIDYESEMAYQLLKFIIKQLKKIEDMVPTLLSATKVGYNKDAKKGIKHWGERRKLWYRSQINKFSKHNVYSTQKILSVVSVSVKKLHGYGHLEEIAVRRVDRQKTFLGIEFKELYTPSYKLPRAIYEDLNKHKRVMRADELYKFSDETLKTVRDELHHRILDFCLRYNKKMSRRKWTAIDKRNSELMVKLIDKKMLKKIVHKESGKIGGCSGTRDGLQTDDTN